MQTKGNLFQLNANISTCLMAKFDDNWIWHRRLCHVNFDNIVKASKIKAVRGLLVLSKPENTLCKECQLGKMSSSTFKGKPFTIENLLDLVHTDLCGPMKTRSVKGDRYFMILTDDCSRMMWVTFLKDKSKDFGKFKAFRASVEKESGKRIKCLRTDQGGEFTSGEFNKYYEEHGIKRQLSAPQTPQQNGLAERNNQTVVEAARTMLIQGKVSHTFWKEAVSTIVYTMNQVLIKKGKDKTPYEYWIGKTPMVSYFRVFGSKCYIKRSEHQSKFDAKCDEGIFLGYSTKSKALKCYNNRTQRIMESINVRVDETFEKTEETSSKQAVNEPVVTFWEPVASQPSTSNSVPTLVDVDGDTDGDEDEEEKQEESVKTIPRYVKLNHDPKQIIGDKDAAILTRRKVKENSCMISEFEPKSFKEAHKDEDWIKAMEEELDQIEGNGTWSLVPRPEHKNVIGTKWVFRNKLNEDGTVIRNKVRLACKGYAQEEEEDYGETFSPVARLEGVHMLLTYVAFNGFKVYQMDVKSVFLNGVLEEEVYIEQPDGFSLSEDSDMVCRLHKALYGLKQAPRAWYELLHSHLVNIRFERTSEDSNIYLKSEGDQILICEVFVDDIVARKCGNHQSKSILVIAQSQKLKCNDQS